MNKWTANVLATGTILALSFGAQAETYPAFTQSPGGTAHTAIASFGNIVSKYTPHQLEVNAGLSGSQYMVGLARGQAKFGSVAYSLGVAMRDGEKPFDKLENAPELWSNIRLLFAYDGGFYHFVTYADSGIDSFDDLEGRNIYAGPPNAAQEITTGLVVEASSGLKMNEDYQRTPVDSSSGQQAFQDGSVDLLVQPSSIGGALIEQYGVSKDIRLIGIPDEALETPAMQEYLEVAGRKVGTIPPDAYSGQINEEPVQTVAYILAVGAHKDVEEDVVYEMMTAMLTNFDEFKASSKTLFGTLTKEELFDQMPAPLHAGAVRAYREAGIDIPENLIPPEM